MASALLCAKVALRLLGALPPKSATFGRRVRPVTTDEAPHGLPIGSQKSVISPITEPVARPSNTASTRIQYAGIRPTAVFLAVGRSVRTVCGSATGGGAGTTSAAGIDPNRGSVSGTDSVAGALLA